VSAMIERARTEIGRRYRQGRDILGAEGMRGIATRARTAGARWLQPNDVVMEIRRSDVIAADLSRPFQPALPKVTPGEPVVMNWVMSPPARGSGGHTTLFRIINYLEANGYRNRVYFYDAFRGDHEYYKSIVRRYYDFHGPVASVDEGMEDAHAVVATAWNTAYAVFNSRCAGKRFYLVQDFEPYFYPIGSISLLAENSYRMGFHAITIGQCFADKLRSDFGMVVDSFEYGSDNARYQRLENSKRSGVVFYARPHAPRRGFELGMMTLEVFASLCPEVEIHIYGHKMGKLPFAFHDHGQVTPAELNQIYNQCYAGLSLSFTNVSLVALEMLSAGCIPIVNESIHIRTDVDNRFVRYALAHPHALASAMEDVIKVSDFDTLSREAAASVPSGSWQGAGARVDAIFRDALSRSQGTGDLSQPAAADGSANRDADDAEVAP
jgi:O-antigen biosynthesis protein